MSVLMHAPLLLIREHCLESLTCPGTRTTACRGMGDQRQSKLKEKGQGKQLLLLRMATVDMLPKSLHVKFGRAVEQYGISPIARAFPLEIGRTALGMS